MFKNVVPALLFKQPNKGNRMDVFQGLANLYLNNTLSNLQMVIMYRNSLNNKMHNFQYEVFVFNTLINTFFFLSSNLVARARTFFFLVVPGFESSHI